MIRLSALINRVALLCIVLNATILSAGSGTVIVNETFEDGKVDGFNDVPPTTTNSKIISGQSHGPGDKAYQITYAVDEFNAKFERYPTSFRSIDVSFWQKLPDGIPISKAGRGYAFLKDFRLTNPDGSYDSNGKRRTTTIEPAISYFRNGFEGQPAKWENGIGVFRVDDTELAYYPEINIIPNQWHSIRYFIKFNDPGLKNGRLMYWFNGVLKVDVKDLWLCDTAAQRPTGVWVGGNFSYGGTKPDFPFRRWLDDIVIEINGDAPSTDKPLTIASVAKQMILEDGATAAIPIEVSRSTGLSGTVNVTATSSSTAIIPAAGLNVTGSGADWKITAKPAANKHGTSTIRVQAQDGAGSGVMTFDVVVKAVADTPSASGTSVKRNRLSKDGLVVRRNSVDGAEVTHFKIMYVKDGTLYLNDGRTTISNGEFLTVAQASAGLRFRPRTGFLGTAFFNVKASTSASDVGLGGDAVTAWIQVTR